MEKKKKNTVVWTVVALVCFAAIIASVFFSMADKEEELENQSQTFFGAVANNWPSASNAPATGSDLQSEKTAAGYWAAIGWTIEFSPHYNTVEATVSTKELRDWQAPSDGDDTGEGKTSYDLNTASGVVKLVDTNEETGDKTYAVTWNKDVTNPNWLFQTLTVSSDGNVITVDAKVPDGQDVHVTTYQGGTKAYKEANAQWTSFLATKPFAQSKE